MNLPYDNHGQAAEIPADERQLALELPTELLDDTSDVHFVPAPCQVACPIGTDAPSYLAYIWEGDLPGALEAITATNPLSGICGRVCDAPCEPACRRADSDGPIAIRNLKRYVMDQLGSGFALPPVPVTRDQTIAVVGSGPAGLTAAQDLAEAGYRVHLYEMTDRLGGMSVWGIPAFRLPVEVIREDIERILQHCPGIEVHLNCALGQDVTLDELKQRHDAVVLAIGAWWGKQMQIPGEDDPRVVDGVSFLRQANGGARPTMPATVLVIGGGDVAMDACRVALRLPGCRQVKVVYRRGPDEIPARKDELHGAIEEGVEFIYNTQPVAVSGSDAGLVLQCITTTLGEPEADGRRRPVPVPGSEHDIHCGLVIAAVGQKTACDELAGRGMIARDMVTTEFAGMRTVEDKVFAAGDGAFGPSTLVNAMYHGHRVAYYVKAFLQGRQDPLPYRTPYRTRRVPVSQDPRWEALNRQEQVFHGLGDNPVAFPEIESRYDDEQARKEAARCFRCDAENGTYEYSVGNREDIFTMARTQADDLDKRRAMLGKRLMTRDNPFPPGRPATIDDVHFLPANLSRLVIDPYREACTSKTPLGPVVLGCPFLAGGFDAAPDDVLAALAGALDAAGAAYFGRRALPGAASWFQLLTADDVPCSEAAALIYQPRQPIVPASVSRCRDDQLLGIVVSAANLAEAIPFALAQACDVLVLDGTSNLALPWAELASEAPDLTPVRDTPRLLRQLKREGDIAVIYYGGVRSGTDAAKFLAMGCDAVVLGVAMGLGLGGVIEGTALAFTADLDVVERQAAGASFLQACTGEVSMMARCTGKTNVHNLEPEDLRSITLATAEATGIPIASAAHG